MKRRFFATLAFLFSATAIGPSLADTQTAKTECERLLNDVIPFAKQMLVQHGEFFPYGGALDASGKYSAIGGYNGNEHPASVDIINLLKNGFMQGAKSGKYRATALVYDVKVRLPNSQDKSDAIAVALDHIESYSVVVYFPYQLTGGKLTFGQTFAEKGKMEIFVEK